MRAHSFGYKIRISVLRKPDDFAFFQVIAMDKGCFYWPPGLLVDTFIVTNNHYRRTSIYIFCNNGIKNGPMFTKTGKHIFEDGIGANIGAAIGKAIHLRPYDISGKDLSYFFIVSN